MAVANRRRHDKIRKTFLSEKVADRGQESADRGVMQNVRQNF